MHNFIRVALYTILFILGCSMQLMAQKETYTITSKNAVYLELGGNGIYYSLNYDRIFFQRKNLKVGARIGFGAVPITLASNTYWRTAVPVELIGFWGKIKHHLELGIGYTSLLIPDSRIDNNFEKQFETYKLSSIIPFRIGYRYQKPNGGFFFRVGYMPTLDFTEGRNSNLTLLHGGISIGKTF